MSFYVSDRSREYERPEEGLHRAVCIDVVDLGVVPGPWGEKRKVELRWALEAVDSKERHFVVRRRYTASLNEKATLRQHLDLWRGRKFTAQELRQFDLEKVIGVQAQVQIAHRVLDDGRTFADVQAVIGAVKGAVPLPIPPTYVRDAARAKAAEPDPFREDYTNTGEADDDDCPF
jgi:hypothetical protein